MSESSLVTYPTAPVDATGNWSDIAPLNPMTDVPGIIDGGIPYSDTTGRIQVSASGFTGRTAVIVIAGQSYGENSPATDPYAVASEYNPPGPVYQLNVFDGNLYRAQDPLLGTDGIGGTMWTRMAERLIESGQYDNVVLVSLPVGGSSITQWIPGGPYYRKLTLAFKELQTLGLTTTQFIWQQGVADSGVLPPATYQQYFLSIVNVLRSHGMTAPIYTSLNSLSSGGISSDPAAFASEAAFSAMQLQNATGFDNLGINQGVNFDNPNAPDGIPTTDYAPDGHFTTQGYDDSGSQWPALLDGTPVIATTPDDGLILRESSSGQTVVATMNNGQLEPIALPSLNCNWELITVFDSTGNGDGDLVLFNATTGDTQIQLNNGTPYPAGGDIRGSPFNLNPGWSVVGAVDFNQSTGYAELVWQNQKTGQVQIMYDDGVQNVGGGVLSQEPSDNSLKVVAVGNGTDGNPQDITLLYQKAGSGILEVQTTNGLISSDIQPILDSPFGASYQVAGMGNFYGDGKDDTVVLVNPATYDIQVGEIAGDEFKTGGTLLDNTFNPNWRVAAVDAANGGIDFQNPANNAIQEAFLHGREIVGGGPINIATTGVYYTDAMTGTLQAYTGLQLPSLG